MSTYRIRVSHEHGFGSLLSEEPVHEGRDAEGEAELYVLAEVSAQVLTVQPIRGLKVMRGGYRH